MSKHETMFNKLPEILRGMETCADTTFKMLIDEGSLDPMTEMANIIAAANDGDGYIYGLHPNNANTVFDDENRHAIRMKDGHGIIVSDDFVRADIKRHLADLAPIDFILFATDVKTSLNGYYMLVRYDLLACYANPYLVSADSIWNFYDGILCECRSAVVDVRDMSIASLPYYKFRNLGETSEYDLDHVRAAIDAADGKIIATEKLDGSMIQMRYVGDETTFANGLLYSTSGTLAGSPSAAGNDHIASLVRYHLTGDELDKHLGIAKAYPNYTLIYEFVHPEADRHVVLYSDDKHGLFLTGARNIETGKLANRNEIVHMASAFDVPVPDVIATDIDTALDIQQNGDGEKMEGMVVDIDGWLVKVKLDGFLALSRIYHEIEGAAGFKAIEEMILKGTLDDAMPSLPEALRNYIDAVVRRLEAFDAAQRAVIDDLVAEELARDGGDRKAFALWVNDLACPSHWKGWLFQTAFGDGVDCFWADKKGTAWRYTQQSEFEAREAALDEWMRS